jgi:hypothetical protein
MEITLGPLDCFIFLRHIATEAIEFGCVTLDDLRTELEKVDRFSTLELDIFFRTLTGRGINNLSDLKNASDRILGGIVVDLECSMDYSCCSCDILEEVESLNERRLDKSKKIV